ncbi:MAG: gliding motility-associated C-terminal domain-containing protein [Bacteroidales bacterium]
MTVLLTISAPTSAPGWAATISCVPDIFNPEDGTACPEVSVGQVINGTITKIDTVQFSCDNPIVMLEANYVATGQYTNDYMVYSIPFGSPFAFNSGTSISATADDNWVTAVPLPFNFSFFGQIYTTAYPGANGLISLSPQPSGSFCKFSYIPTAIPKYNYQNCIYGVYEDIDPRYYLNPAVDDIRMDVLGTSPCRAFVFNYLNVGLFGKQGQGNDWYNTYQMVMYEGTNIIEVHIKHRKCCASTNGGSTNGTNEGIVGLQNLSGSQEVIAPGRGMTGWEVLGTNYEAWRFVPITPLDEQGELTWYENTVSPATALGHNKKLPVSPDTTTRYIAEYTFTNAAGDEFQLLDTVLVVVDIPSIIVVNSANGEICPGDSVYLDVNCQEANRIVSYEWSSGATESRCLVKPDVSTNYTVTVTFDNRCTATMSSSVTIKPLEYPQITGDSVVCQGHPVTLNAVTIDGISYQWNTGAVTSTIHVTPFDTTEYTVTSTLQNGCTTSSTYVVNVWANPMASFIPDPPLVYVENGVGTVNFNDNSMDAITWHWNFGDQYSLDNTSMLPSPSHIYTHPGFFNVVQTVKNENGCVDSVSYRITVEVPFFYYIPNAFTPNNDGVNDVFAPKGEGVDPDKFEMTLYDRFGKLMFRTRTPYDYWDGKTSTGQLCPLGAYVYVINFTTLDGEVKEYTGTVTLVR